MSYDLFRHLCDTLEIRDNSRADRDRSLYIAVCSKLGMGRLKPKEFFAENPAVTDARVLVCFLDTMEPFAKMLELIYDVCSQAKRGGTGGRDLVIRYDSTAESLRFDLEAFKRYKRIREAVQFKGIVPKFHSDYVPSYPSILRQLTAGPPFRWWNKASGKGEPTLDEFTEVIELARSVGEAHCTMLDDLIPKLTEAPEEGDPFHAWLKEHGIGGSHLPYSRENIRGWRDSIQAGLDQIDRIRVTELYHDLSSEDRTQTVEHLRRILNAIAITQNFRGWRDSVEEWLRLPYWKKRWQVYEVWVVALCLRSFLNGGGILNPDAEGQLVLRTGASAEPLAKLRLNGRCEMEVWCEFPLPSAADPRFRPDIVIALRSRVGRLPLHFIECKQRATEKLRRILRDASKYLEFMPCGSEHLLVNYDAWEESPLRSPRDGRSILAIGDARPDGVGYRHIEQFVSSIVGGVEAWVLVIDTTESMSKWLPEIAVSIEALKGHLAGDALIWLVLFGDHKDTYTVQLHFESDDPIKVAEALLHAPRTHGYDDPEAHEDAMHFVCDTLHKSQLRKAKIALFSDAPAHKPADCPNGYNFEEEVRRLLKEGHQVTLVACGKEPSELGWNAIPGVKAIRFDQHDW